MSSEGRGSDDSRVAVPAPVEVVISFGFSPDLVSSIYRQLLTIAEFSGAAAAVWPRGDVAAARDSSSQGHVRVSAVELLVAVDGAIRRSSVSSPRVDDIISQSALAADAPTGSTNLEPRHQSDDDDDAAAIPAAVQARDFEVSGDIQDDSDRIQHGENNSAGGSPGDSLTSNVEASTARSGSQSTNRNDPNVPETSTDVSSVAGTAISSLSTSSAPAPVVAAMTAAAAEPANGPTTSDTTAAAVSPGSAHSEVTAMTSSSTSGIDCPGQVKATCQNSDQGPTHAGPCSGPGRPVQCERNRDSSKDSGVAEDKARLERRRQLERLRALRAENRRLKALKTCRQCRQRPVALTLLPCGHFCFCQECGSSFNACPICKKTILADVRTFVS